MTTVYIRKVEGGWAGFRDGVKATPIKCKACVTKLLLKFTRADEVKIILVSEDGTEREVVRNARTIEES